MDDDIYFADYRYSQSQQVLYRNKEIIPLKRNQTVLLAFFLRAPEIIHSKDAIMDAVWQGRVVSEQVVFQTISQLRSIFGDAAIQTFSKKGYKWNIALNQTPLSAQGTLPVAHKKLIPSFLIGAGFAFSLILAMFFLSSETPQKHAFKVLGEKEIQQFDQSEFGELAGIILRENSNSADQQDPIDISIRQAFAAPKFAWHEQKLDADIWLAWGDTYAHSQGLYLHYVLAKDEVFWEGYIFSKNEDTLQRDLSKRLQVLHSLGLFTDFNNELDFAAINSMYEAAPDDAELQVLMGQHYIDVGQLDVAMTYLERVLEAPSNFASKPTKAQAHWLVGKIYKMRSQHLQAFNSLEAMTRTLSDTSIWPLKLHNITTNAWLAFEENKPKRMIAVLDKAVESAVNDADPLTLFEIHMLYSTLAQKTGYENKKYRHLHEAQAILLKHKLDEVNFAIVYHHFALFTQDNEKALPYLEKILALPKTSANYWIHQEAMEMMVEHHLLQQDIASAEQLLQGKPGTARNILLRSKVILAEGNTSEAKEVLQKAYKAARVNYDLNTAISAAFSLFQLTVDDDKQRAQYLAYIESNASPNWLKDNHALLAEE